MEVNKVASYVKVIEMNIIEKERACSDMTKL